MEVWLEPVLDGTLLHYFLRATPADAAGAPRAPAPRELRREFDRRARAAQAIAPQPQEILEGRGAARGPPRGDEGERPGGDTAAPAGTATRTRSSRRASGR